MHTHLIRALGTMARRGGALALALALCSPLAGAQITANFSATPVSGTNPVTVFFTDTSTGETPVSWSWNFGDGTGGSGQNPAHVYTKPGDHTVTLTVFGDGGGFDTETKTALIHVDPRSITVGFEADVTLGSSPLQVAFTNTTVGFASAWLWDFGDGGTSTVEHPTRIYGQVGTYSVTLTAFNGGQQDTLTRTGYVTVKPQWTPQQIISNADNGAADVSTGDLDSDGDLDVLVAFRLDGTVAWYENLDGLGTLGPKQPLILTFSDAVTVAAADLDGDLDVDVVAGRYPGGVLWLENLDGAGSFAPGVYIAGFTGNANRLELADLDGDDAPDLLVASLSPNVVWLRNQLSVSGDWGPPQVLSAASATAEAVHAADLDGDLDMDVLYASRSGDTIAWFENTDGLGSFGPEQALPSPFGAGPEGVHAADLDGDLDLDVLGALTNGDEVVWFENTDGAGTFGPSQVINDAMNAPARVLAADLDSDGDQDVLTVAAGGAGVNWFENVDGQGGFGPTQPILAGTFTLFGFFGLHAADLDGDGDPDVFTAGNPNPEVSWFQNVRRPPFWAHLGGAAPGVNGLPTLRPTGELTPGSPLTLTLDGAPANSLMLAWLSFSSTPFDVLGGTLHANPPTVQILRASDAAGAWSQTINWQASIPAATDFWMQFIIADASTPAGLTLSNGITATTR